MFQDDKFMSDKRIKDKAFANKIRFPTLDIPPIHQYL